MFIQTEHTPNPATLKFLPGRPVLARGTAEFTKADQAATSPLAQRLFAVDGVKAVFFGQDFITVTKEETRDWATLKTFLLSGIMEHFVSNQPVMQEQSASDSSLQDHAAHRPEDEAVVTRIKELLDTRIRPAVAQDGGDIIFQSYDNGVVHLMMRGACAGCPSSTATLKAGVENMLRHYVPEVTEVRAVK